MLLYLSIALLIIGIIFFFIGFKILKIRHLLQNTPTSKIRSIAMGFSEVCGKVRIYSDKHVMNSPITNQPCVYYKYQIWEYKKSGKDSAWQLIKFNKCIVHFYLEDETGKILIDPSQAKIKTENKYKYETSHNIDPPKSIINFLYSLNIDYKGFFGFNRHFKFIEWCIKPNDKLYITGTVVNNPYVQDATVTDGVANMMISRGRNIKFNLISSNMEKTIVFKYTAFSVVSFILGSLISVLSLIGLILAVI